MVCPIDPDYLEITLKAALENQASAPLDSFLQTCQNWRQDFEQTGEDIIKANMIVFYKLKDNLDSFSWIANSNFVLLEEVSSWANDLTTLREIKSQKYQMLTSIYTVDEIDKVEQ